MIRSTFSQVPSKGLLGLCSHHGWVPAERSVDQKGAPWFGPYANEENMVAPDTCPKAADSKWLATSIAWGCLGQRDLDKTAETSCSVCSRASAVIRWPLAQVFGSIIEGDEQVVQVFLLKRREHLLQLWTLRLAGLWPGCAFPAGDTSIGNPSKVEISIEKSHPKVEISIEKLSNVEISIEKVVQK